MATYNPSHAQFWFEIGGQPVDTFQLLEFYGSETISQLYRFELSLASPVDNDLNLPELLNQPAKLVILREEEKKELHGILSELEEIGRNKDFAFFRAVLVPRVWRLSLYYQSRVFQNKSVPDIIKEVMKGAGLNTVDYKLDLATSYQPREYCVQYRESDFNLICRLMEYEGITFFFDHSGGKDLLVIVDDKRKFPKIESPDEIASVVGEGLGPHDQETVGELAWHEKMVTGKVVLKDYNYRTPETALSAESQIEQESPGIYYEYGDHFKTAAQGKNLATIRNQEIEAARRIITGSSDCRGFHPGYNFSLVKHYRDSLNGTYLLTQVSHFGSQKGGMSFSGSGDGSTPDYRNEFTCIPTGVQYRPPRLTPEPRVSGIMTARVESTGGEYAHLDEEGRYKVKMPFDLSDSGQGKASRAIRLAQPYSGSGYGMHFPVHAGTELVWACVDGNVDRPLGLSSVPNPSQSSPVAAGNKTQNVLRSAAGNQIILDDMKGETQIELRTADGHVVLLDDKEDRIEITTTKKHTVILDDKEERIFVGTADGREFIMDDKNSEITIMNKRLHYITLSDGSGNESITLSDAGKRNQFIIDITNNKLLMKTAEGDIDIQAPSGTLNIKANRLNIETSADIAVKAETAIAIKAETSIKIDASEECTINAQKITEKAMTDHAVSAMNIKAQADMNYEIKGGMNVKSEAGVNSELKAGLALKVQASGPMQIQGMPVAIN